MPKIFDKMSDKKNSEKVIKLKDICKKESSPIVQKDLDENNGAYPIYGAGGFIKNVDFYKQNKPYIAVVKDGAGVGRVMKLPAKSSVIGTMQYIIPNDDVDVGYLAYLLEHMNLSKYYTGAAIPHIYFKDYGNEEVSVHNVKQQKQIAYILDKITNLISLRNQQLSKLDELVKAKFVEMFGAPEFNIKEWKVYNLEQLCNVSSSKRIYQNEQTVSGIPFLRIADLVNLIETGNAESTLFISTEKYDELNGEGFVPTQGDVLVTSRGTLGRCYIVKSDDKFYFQDGMISWLSNFNDIITEKYLVYLFSMPGFRKNIDELQAGSTVAYLSIAMLKKMKIMVPDKDLQKQFADFVTQTDKTKEQIKAGLEKLEILKNALMQEYFG